jgi:hypothetical protein
VLKDVVLLRHVAARAVEKINAINSKIWEEFNHSFKVGDRVKVIKNIGHPHYDCNIGQEFDVLAADGGKDVDINAPSVFGADSSVWHFSELELVREGEK